MKDLELFCSQTGYTPINPAMWIDLGLAERAGNLDKCCRELFNSIKDDYKKLTEFVMYLNWKIWWWDGHDNQELAEKYNALWEKYDYWCCDNLEGEAADYFYSTTD